MSHQSEIEKKKYRNWVRGCLAYKYLKQGLEGFADDIVTKEHGRILRSINLTPGKTCNQCSIGSLRPLHPFSSNHSGRKYCHWGQHRCNCLHTNKQKCRFKICDSIMEEILKSHGSSPPAPNWANTDLQKWCTEPWEVAKCFINAPGYSDKTKAVDIDISGLLHVFINYTNLHSHLACSMTGRNIFIKIRERRNSIFHSPSMEIEDTEVNECLNDIIAILEDAKELKTRIDAERAVTKVKQMKNNDFIITTHNEIEVCREVLSTVKNKTIFLEQLIKDTMNDINSKRGDAIKAIDDKMQASLQDALEALENNGEIKNLKQAVQLMNAKVDNFETDFKQDTVSLLDPSDAYIFNEALKKGKETDSFVRINVVGNYKQGKTSLTRRLLNQSLEGVESTDGIDVHVRKCKIKNAEWESSPTEFDENDYLEKLVQGTMRMKYSKIKNSQTDHAESTTTPNSMPTESNTEESVTEVFSNENLLTDEPNQRAESETSESISGLIASGENTRNEAKNKESFIAKNSSQLKEKMNMPLDETLTANIWDFGGQFIYYATHQIFHSRDAIYLLVFDLTKDLKESIKDKEFPYRKSSMGDCLKFWLDSIHAYAGSDEVGGTSKNVQEKPFVILVGTFKDLFEGSSEKKFEEVFKLFVHDPAMKHLLSEQYAVSNTNMSDEEVQYLKSKIFELGMKHAEDNSVPMKWTPLKIAILAEKSKNIMTFEEVKNLNTKNYNLVEEEELKTFLKYLHLKGTIIFFDDEDLEGHIVVNPQYLVDAFRCVIGSKSCIKDAKLYPLWHRLNETSILENELLDAMLKKEVEKDFLKHKEVLLMFLQRHRILSKLFIMDEAGNISYQDKYMIPSLLKHHCEQRELKIFTNDKCATLVSLGLRIENTALLTSLYERITAGALGKWPPVVKDKRVFVFQNIGLFKLDRDHVGKVELKPGKGIQLTVINQCPELEVRSNVCDYFRRYIERLIKHDFQKGRNHMYTSNFYKHYLVCNDRSHDGKGSEDTYDMDEYRNIEKACCPDYGYHSIKCKSAIDEWFLSGKTTDLYEIPDRLVTKKELNKIAGCIGHNWRLLGIALGVRTVELDHLEMNHRRVETCIYEMLCKWEQIKQDDATLLQLITCMDDNQAVNVDWDMIKNIIEGSKLHP